MKLELDLPERILCLFEYELKFSAFTDNYPDLDYQGTLNFIDSRINTQTRTIKAYALLNNPDGKLKPGILMKVDLFLEQVGDALLVPEEAVIALDKKHFVYITNDNKAIMKEVEIGIRNDSKIEIIDGLHQKIKLFIWARKT